MVWRKNPHNFMNIANDRSLIITNNTNGGIFSASTIILKSIMTFFALIGKEPETLVTTSMYYKYNYLENHENYTYSDNDMYSHFFKIDNDLKIEDSVVPILQGNFNIIDEQFFDYKTIDYNIHNLFIKKYFTPTDEVNGIITKIENDYINKYDYSNLCVLFYRGNDKQRETNICSYEDIVLKAKELQTTNPHIVFLIQSDELEFIQKMSSELPNSFYFGEELSNPISVDRATNNVDVFSKMHNYIYGKNFIAITVVMSRCKYIICTSGNCSCWIAYFRGNAENVFQYLHNEWV
jgi:hypothetical protein